MLTYKTQKYSVSKPFMAYLIEEYLEQRELPEMIIA